MLGGHQLSEGLLAQRSWGNSLRAQQRLLAKASRLCSWAQGRQAEPDRIDTGGTTQCQTMAKLKRQFVPLYPAGSSCGSGFRITQWNLLADGLAQHGDFVKVGLAPVFARSLPTWIRVYTCTYYIP